MSYASLTADVRRHLHHVKGTRSGHLDDAMPSWPTPVELRLLARLLHAAAARLPAEPYSAPCVVHVHATEAENDVAAAVLAVTAQR